MRFVLAHRKPRRPNKTFSTLKEGDLCPQRPLHPDKISVFWKWTLEHCTGLGWDGVSFLRSSSYGATLQICDQNHTDNTSMFQLLLNYYSHYPSSEQAGGAQEIGRGHSRDS